MSEAYFLRWRVLKSSPAEFTLNIQRERKLERIYDDSRLSKNRWFARVCIPSCSGVKFDVLGGCERKPRVGVTIKD